MNWHSIIKILNAHNPHFVSFCHYDDEDITTLNLEFPEELGNYFHSLNYEHINMKFDETISVLDNHQEKLDVRIGATFSQIMIREMVGEGLAIYCTSFDGKKLVRLDKNETFQITPINPLEILEMSGHSFSMTKVSNQPFEFDEFLPEITGQRDSKDYLNKRKLKAKGNYNPDTEKVELTDSKGNTLFVDSRTKHGYWLEDIVMRKLAMAYPTRQVYTNVTRNHRSKSKQIRLGLKRTLEQIQANIPFVQRTITQYLSLPDQVLTSDEIENIVSNMDDNLFRENVPEEVYDIVFRAGALNEFDGIIIKESGIITIEIKATKPKIEQVIKLESFSKYLAPVKGSLLILVHNYYPDSESDLRNYNRLLLQIVKQKRRVFLQNYLGIKPNQ